MAQATILIIDDRSDVAEAMRERLASAGYTVLWAASSREGVQAFLDAKPDAVVVRDGLPGSDGWDTARRIREMSGVPIAFISDRRDTFSMERALHIGDEYLSPPWNWDRLVARLAVLLRRRRENAADEMLAYADGRLSIDFASRQVTKDGQPVHLTDTEFKLLSCFVRHPSRVLTYEELLTQVWGHTHFGAKSHVSLYVRYLRKKLEDDPARPAYFTTEWGVGYVFRPHLAGAEAAAQTPTATAAPGPA